MKRIDIILPIVVILLTFFGLLMIYEASSYVAFRDFADKYHYIKDQLMWVGLGFSGLIFFTFFDYHKLHNLSLPLLLGTILLLFLVFMPGIGVYALGAHRWINLRFLVLQPTELIKPAFAIYLAAWFSNKERGRFMAFALLMGLVFFLIMLEPDMGTAGIVLLQGLVIYFLSGANLIYFVSSIPVIGFLVFLLVKLEPYRAERLSTFLSHNSSVMTSSYHVRQILIALGMGGLTGVGLGNSLQKYAYLPETTTDSIFAIIAEEFGFIGSLIFIFLLVIVIWRGFLIGGRAKDTFGRLLAGGLISFLAIQMIINLGAQTLLIPLTGVPLPFISYGGSALVIDLCSIGILLNISRQGKN